MQDNTRKAYEKPVLVKAGELSNVTAKISPYRGDGNGFSSSN
jgi:hypothetical protein